MGPFRWVKHSPIFESNLAHLIRANTDELLRADLDSRVEMGPSIGWNSLLMGLFWFWLKLCSNGCRRSWIALLLAGLNWYFRAETDLSSFSVGSSPYGPGVRANNNNKKNQPAPKFSIIGFLFNGMSFFSLKECQFSIWYLLDMTMGFMNLWVTYTNL